jgi:signal transduction histidine kinase
MASELMAFCDPLQLQQVLFNLFLNARQAMEKAHGGILKVTGQRIPAQTSRIQSPSHLTTNNQFQIELHVHNSGAPIPKHLLPHLFEPFQSTKSAKNGEKSRCHGLGLSLCRELVEENGGSIGVSSTEDAGTTFTLILPSS